MLVMVFGTNSLFASATNEAVTLIIKNKATVTIENSTKETNEVENPVKELLPSTIVKKIIDEDGKEVDSIKIDAIDTELTFKGTIQITDDEDIDSVILKDVLNNAFDFVRMQVLDSDGKDITDQGKESVEDKEVSFEFNPDVVSSLKGEKISWFITIRYNPAAPVDKEEGEEYISLPNVMELHVNGKPVVSPPVEVLVPPIEASITQRVLTATGDEALDDVFTDNQRDIIFRGTSEITNATQLEHVSVDEELHPALSFKAMKILTAEGEDITDKGEVKVDGQSLGFEFNPEFVSTMYGKTFVWEVTTNYVEGSDLSSLENGKIPNVMNLHVNDQVTSSDLSLESNAVTVSPIPLETGIVKKIVDGDSLVDSKEIVSINEPIDFVVFAAIPNDVQLKKVMIQDVLDERIEYVNLKVEDSTGEDVTEWGDITVENQVVTFTFKEERMKDLHGQNFKVTISTKVKESVTQEELNTPIENTAFLFINDTKVESNKVIVTPNIPEEILPQTGEQSLWTGVIGSSIAVAGTAGFAFWMKKRSKLKK